MKLKELKNIVSVMNDILIENTAMHILFNGYYNWFKDVTLDNKEVRSIYSENDVIHIIIQ